MTFSWLKRPREAAGWTQEALATALGSGYSTRIIGRLERCEPETPAQVPYPALAQTLGVCPIQLAEHHARDLESARLQDHANRARTAADSLRRAQHFKDIDPSPIQSALHACQATGLIARIAERESALTDEEAQATHIARMLNAGNLDQLASLLNKPLRETIAAAEDHTALDALAQFVRAVARACSANDPQLASGTHPGRWIQHHGETRAWAYTAMIDAACKTDGLRLIRLQPSHEPRIDDDSSRAVRAGRVTQTSLDGRLYELVVAVADLLAFDGDKPKPGAGEAFTDFCRGVNRMLWDLNYEDAHVFGLWEQIHCEPDEVKERLLQCLPDLRLFDCGEVHRGNSVLRVDADKLETWFAARLQAINGHREILATTPAQANPSAPITPIQEPRPMSTPKDTGNNYIFHTGNGPVYQALDHAQQVNLTVPQNALMPLLNQLMSATASAEPHYVDLRKACRDAQGELEEQAVLSAPTKTRLKKVIEALPVTDKAFGLAIKVGELIEKLSKIPGLGT